MKDVAFLIPGILFGIALVKGEAISWLRIQEMARLHGFQLYGIFLAANGVGIISLLLLRRLRLRTLHGDPITVPRKTYHHGNVIGGFLFGVGLSLSGACPGPMYALLGSGASIAIIMILSALAGTWTYGYLRPRLPH